MYLRSIQEVGRELGIGVEDSRGISHFAIDSRKVEKGGLFFALPGERTDGHDFLESAAEKGAICAVVHESYLGEQHGLVLLRVPDVRSALQLLGSNAYRRRREKVIAITGSMGKTTTKEFLSALLAEKYSVAKSPASYNSQLTVPLTILNLGEKTDFLVLEMAMNRKGEIQRLTEIAPPDVGVVTAIAPAGMENFAGGLDAIADAKGEIFSQDRTAFGFIGKSAARFRQILYRGGAKKWIYGKKGPESRICDAVIDSDFHVHEQDGGMSPPLPLGHLPGHLIENALGAIAVCRYFGLSWVEIVAGCAKLRAIEKRFQVVEKGGITFVSDCYNANPVSMKAAFAHLPKPKEGGQVVGVLGAMPDLGERSREFHREVGEEAAKTFAKLYCIGQDAKILSNAFSASGKKGAFFESLNTLQEELHRGIAPGDVVLLKGGNSHSLWKLLEEVDAAPVD